MIALRLATPDDHAAIAAVMSASARDLSRGFYTPAQIPSFIAHVAQLDPVLISDRHYFLLEDAGVAVACGGWSDRRKLFSGPGASTSDDARLVPGLDPARIRAMFVHPSHARRGLGRRLLDACEHAALTAGFTTAELMATAPGLPLYLACGYLPLEHHDVVLPDGVVIACTRMTKPLLR
jgi:GNAT superfamily N-acetyltransferase